MPLFTNCFKVFERIEFGFRIQFPNTNSVSNHSDLCDPKYIHDIENVQFRTFCWCKKGEVILSNFNGIQTYSGRADCEPTDFSNFGFNIRIKSEFMFPNLVKELLEIKPFMLKMQERSNLKNIYSEQISEIVLNGLEKLLQKFPSLDFDDVVLIGPTLEGIGYYPEINENLKSKVEDFYFIGDCCGIFRGIIPSMLSGYWLSNSF
jgi:uncharacterized FAD-dependent dehydrogenase